MQPSFKTIYLGNSAIMLDFGQTIDAGLNAIMVQLKVFLDATKPMGVHEVVAAYASVTVLYDLQPTCTAKTLTTWLETALPFFDWNSDTTPQGRKIEVPTVYDGEDLHYVATWSGLTEHEVVELHSATEYRVYMLGFMPGFAYLGGLDARIAVPRRPSPRLQVPAGSVGIAGMQTGVYPVASPGGWQLIGRTETKLFDRSQNPPNLLQAGDYVRFVVA